MKDNDRIRQLFERLKITRWVLYIPEKVYAAHKAGLLPWWWQLGGVRALYDLLSFLREHSISLQIPCWEWQINSFLQENFPGFIVRLQADSSQCPPLPEHVITDDQFWNSFLECFGLVGKRVTDKILAHESWAYRIRFFSVSVSQMGARVRWPYEDDIRREGLTEAQVAERRETHETERQRVENEARRMRKEFGLSIYVDAGCRGKGFPGKLVVLKKAYSPEQVTRVRRKAENILRHDPAEVIRYGLERDLVK